MCLNAETYRCSAWRLTYSSRLLLQLLHTEPGWLAEAPGAQTSHLYPAVRGSPSRRPAPDEST